MFIPSDPRFPWPVLALILVGACAHAEEERERRPNVLLITIDTLRADRLGCYGYERPISSRVDRFASEAVRFERAYASSSWTLPSLASLLTSLYPSAHGCRGDSTSLSAGCATLAEVLGNAGYGTGAVASHVYLARRYGLDKGFDAYDVELLFESSRRNATHLAVSSPRVTGKAVDWLETHANDDAPWFLWAHYFDPHAKYKAHAEHDGRFAAGGPSDLYDGEIDFTDRHLGVLFDALESLDLTERTIVVLSADHGEEFCDHGGVAHRATLYEEVLRVPLLVRVPGYEPGVVSEPVSLVDVLPTICELVGVPPPSAVQGVSFVPALEGEPWTRGPLIAELENPFEQLQAVIDGPHKLIRAIRAETVHVFDIVADPEEYSDLATDRPDLRIDLARSLERLLEASRVLGEGLADGPRVILSESDRDVLRSLGYAGDDESSER